jgi:hypothetical protein
VILVDTSVWIDHLRAEDPLFSRLLIAEEILSHPGVVGELALGNLGTARQRGKVLQMVEQLPEAVVADHDEVLMLVEQHQLFGTGIGYVDAQLLASTRLTPGTSLWARDRRLRAAAVKLGIAAALDGEG